MNQYRANHIAEWADLVDAEVPDTADQRNAHFPDRQTTNPD